MNSPYTCCLFSGSGDYKDMEGQLNLFIGRFEFQREIRPFMCSYRYWAIYLVDTRNMKPAHEIDFLVELGKLIRSYPARIFAIWSTHTLDRLLEVDPGAVDQKNCVFCDSPDWVDRVIKSLKRYERKQHDQDKRKE